MLRSRTFNEDKVQEATKYESPSKKKKVKQATHMFKPLNLRDIKNVDI